MFDCYLKRVIYNKRFEMTYVALSQVNNNNNNNKQCVCLPHYVVYR